MASVGIREALALLLLLMAAVKAEAEGPEGGVTVRGNKVTMTCPKYGEWFRLGKSISNGTKHTFTYTYDSKGLYYCKYKDEEERYYFYVQGKVCENCFELDGIYFVGAIVADILLTVAVMLTICKCTKGKSSWQPPHSSKGPAHVTRAAAGASEYQELNQHTRAADAYSRMG